MSQDNSRYFDDVNRPNFWFGLTRARKFILLIALFIVMYSATPLIWVDAGLPIWLWRWIFGCLVFAACWLFWGPVRNES